MRYEIVVQQTRAVRSSIASANFSAGIEPSASGRTCTNLGTAELLRVGDLANRGELVLADHDARAAAALERQSRHDRVDALRDGCRHRDLVGLAMQEPGKPGPRGLGPLDPELPLGAVLVPPGEVLLVGSAHPVRERPLRTGVEIGRMREDRELVPNRLADATAHEIA